MSYLKKKLGQHVSPLSILPPIDMQGELRPEPPQILERRSRQVNNRGLMDGLVKWQGMNEE